MDKYPFCESIKKSNELQMVPSMYLDITRKLYANE